MSEFKILIKFPTRSRTDKFFNVLDIYYKNLKNRTDFHFLITCDTDDISMNNDLVIRRLNKYKNLSYQFLDNKNKVQAINNGINELEYNYDIILVASDDMIPQVYGYDDIIREKMLQFFPDTDGVLWFNDGYQGNRLNTLCILGKKYYDRFKYVYHPSYISLWCDNEFTEVANILNKQVYFQDVIIKHQHPVWIGEKWDELQIRNDRYNNIDRINYLKRKEKMFDL